MLKTVGLPKMASPNKSLNSHTSCRPDFYKLFAGKRLTDMCGWVSGLKQFCASCCTLCTPIRVSLSRITEVLQSQNGGSAGYLGGAGVRARLRQPQHPTYPRLLSKASHTTVTRRSISLWLRLIHNFPKWVQGTDFDITWHDWHNNNNTNKLF